MKALKNDDAPKNNTLKRTTKIDKVLSVFVPEKGIGKSIFIIVFLTIITFGLGFLFENIKVLDGKFLSEYMTESFARHERGEIVFTYFLYYFILYTCIILYGVFSIYICARRKSVDWCALVIAISIIFLVFMNAYLTEIIRDGTHGETMYTAHIDSCIAIATILSAIAGIKMTYLLEKDKKQESNDNPSK